jgi:hypothetical protein
MFCATPVPAWFVDPDGEGHSRYEGEGIVVEWEIHGLEFGNCNCAYGCGCQFNALPTHGHCRAVAFFRVDEGHFGKTRLIDNILLG